MLENEIKTFEQKLPELLKSNAGKFALIKEDNVIRTFSVIDDALIYGYEKYLNQPFLVREITPLQEPLDFTNNHFVC